MTRADFNLAATPDRAIGFPVPPNPLICPKPRTHED